jgi:hypothetical protein
MRANTIRTVCGSAAVSAALLFWAGCGPGDNEPIAENAVGSSGPDAPGGPPPGGPGPGGGRSSPIRKIMERINDRRPDGLTKAIAKGLEPQTPDWPILEKQSGEYAQLAADLAKHDPPRGSKESWTRLTSAFAESATDLDQAVHSKKRDDSIAASGNLSNSCMECHREHRRMPGGGFGPRGKSGPGPGGGPPPGGGPLPGGGPPPGGAPPPGGPPTG